MPEEADVKTDEKEKSGGKGKSLKIIIAVVAAVAIEGGIIAGTAMFTSGPKVTLADNFQEDTSAEDERIVEIPILHERFPNTKQGVVMLYDTQITIQVKKKNQEKVTSIIEENQARIKMLIGTIWRNAEPRHFNEPFLNTLTRQVRDGLAPVVNQGDTSEEGRLVDVLIPTLVGWRGDN